MTVLFRDLAHRPDDVWLLSAWFPFEGMAWEVGDYIVPTTPNGVYYKCIQAGAGGETPEDEPDWDSTIGAVVADNQALWECGGLHPGWTGITGTTPALASDVTAITGSRKGVVAYSNTYGVNWNQVGGLSEAYVAANHKVTAFTYGSAGINVVFGILFDDNPANTVMGGLLARDEGAGPFYRIRYRHNGAAVNDDSIGAWDDLGIWAHYELYIKTGNGDGILRIWKNGTVLFEKTDLVNNDKVLVRLNTNCTKGAGGTVAGVWNDAMASTSRIFPPARRRRGRGRLMRYAGSA